MADGDQANVSLLRFGAHTGTHVDAPAHFIEGGAKVDSLSLETLIGEAIVVEIPLDACSIAPEHLTECDLSGVERVLFKTRNSGFWHDPENRFRTDFTYLETEAAVWLVEAGVRLVGIDYLSIERFGSKEFETHRTLLSKGVIILEGLDLQQVAPGRYELICLPIKLAGGCGDGAPARAVLRT
jgi:arylformamidase